MQKLTFIFITSSMVLSLLSPSALLAEVTSTTTPILDAPALEVITSTPDIETSTSTPPIQDTANIQETLPGSDLESTLNPNESNATSTATTTEPVIPTDEQPVPDEVPLPVEEIQAEPLLEESLPEDVVAVVSEEELRPKPKFVFKMRTGRLPAKRVTSHNDNKKIKQEEVTSEPAMTTDDNEGSLTLSGACSSKYYVVLMYRNATDYDTDPRSYIINKAYECKGGYYMYSIKDLPKNISEGTYYLLVADMSDTGSWTPMSAIIPVDINNN